MTRRKKESRHVHDLVWRRLLGQKSALRELLTDFVPEAAPLCACLDFDNAVLVPRSFVGPQPRALESDVVWKVPAGEKRECFVYVLIEHQSKPEYLMALRLLRYMTALYDTLLEEAEAKRKRFGQKVRLPLIVPIVIYCGEGAWTAPLRLEDLLEASPPGVTPPISLRYSLVEARRQDRQRLRRVGNALAALFVLEKARLEGDKTGGSAFIEVLAGETDRSFVEAVLVAAYTIRRARGGPVTPDRIRGLLHARRPTERTMALTMREFLEMSFGEAALKRGLEKGMEKGLEKGMEKGERASLLKALASLRAWMRRHGIDPQPYDGDLAAISDLAKVMSLMANLAGADDPAAYLRRRFHH